MVVPYGIIADVAAVALGGVLGGLLKKVMPKRIIESLFIVTAFCAFGIGIVSTIKLSSLTVVMVSVILGCVIGELCRIETGIQKLIGFTVNKLNGKQLALLDTLGEEERQKAQEDMRLKVELLSLSMAIICFSGTGFFGALSEGLDGDHSILLAKSVLDFFTVLVIAAQIGYFVSVFAAPQAVIFLICFFIASLISPILTSEAVANFKSVGGVLTLVIGYNMLASQTGLKKVRVLNLIPAFILVLFFSWLVTLLPFAI
ncbi:MAG: DUF554 family protein [Candidatus Coproplasma sp.]